MKKTLLLLSVFAFFHLTKSFSQSATLDSSFNGDGIKNKPAGFAYAIAIQPDGKILVGGNSPAGFTLVRYTVGGNIDKNFGVNGTATAFANGEAEVNAIVVKPGGNIFAAGSSGSHFGIAKFTSAGNLDSSFGENGTVSTNFFGHDEHVYSLAVQDDNKLVACGTAFDGGGSDESRFALARYKTDGTLDSSFTKDGKWSQHVNDEGFEDGRSVIIQPGGKIVAVGDADLNASRNFALIRFRPNGKIDSSFGKNGFALTNFGGYDLCEAAATQSDGKIIAVGGTLGGNMVVARYTADGKLDSTFGTNGSLITNFNSGGATAYGVTVLKDNRIVVVGQVGGIFSLVRLTGNGAVDSSFASSGYFNIVHGNANAVTEQPNGKICAVGAVNNNFFVCRLKNADQNKNATFDDASIASINKTGLQLFPNPAKDVLHIKGLSTQQTKLSIYNAEGKLMLQSVTSDKTGDINIQQLAPGSYYLQIVASAAGNNKNISNLKFIKQ